MKLSEVKLALNGLQEVEFVLPNGEKVPSHYHVTEVGQVEKRFIDCGGTLRKESVITFQLWTSTDYDHRLSGQKLQSIIALSEKSLLLDDREVEVEFQSETIGKYNLNFDGAVFHLVNQQTDCLAKDNCGIPKEKVKIRIGVVENQDAGCCSPSGGCC